MTPKADAARLTTGVPGLDEILRGGLIPQRAYLVRGGPGSGKTTLGLHFLAAGAAAGERCLAIAMEESEQRMRANAALRSIDLSAVTVLDISPTSRFFEEVESYDIFSPAEVERAPLTHRIIEQIEATAPQRVFLDPMTQFRYLSADAFQFRRQVVSLLRYLVEKGATVFYTSEKSASLADDDLQFIADGVIDISRGPHGRTIEIAKLRGSDFLSGLHALRLVESGIAVFPRMEPVPQQPGITYERLTSGLATVDALLGGGIERGATSLISGPSGVGKTTLGLQFMTAAASRGERAIVYSFEEEASMMLNRCDGIGMPAREMVRQGRLEIRKVEPLQYTPDEFAFLVRDEVTRKGTRIVMLDSVAGFMLSLRGDDLRSRMHALAKYLQNVGVAVIIINEQETIVGDFRATESGLSYLSDNMVFMRYLEISGELRRAIGVLKKRLGNFENTLREFSITAHGIEVGEPLTGLRGILRGMPEFVSVPEEVSRR